MGGGGAAVRFRPNTKSGGPFIVWHRGLLYLNTLLPVTIMAEGGEAPEAPSLDTSLQASIGYTCNR